MEWFEFGVAGLDTILSGALSRGSLLVVAGHPGSGKTTLASTICYRNALNGHKCLYISLQEDKEKLFRNMKRLGIDLYDIEGRGLLGFLKLPLTADAESIFEVYIGTINRFVLEHRPTIIVVDSITPILKAIEGGTRARAVLQNFFFELPKLVNGLVVLVAEIPLAEERIEPGDIEFVADTILIMRHRVVDKLLHREIEIRKARGAPLSIARIFFSIAEGQGIKVYIPPRLAEIPPPKIGIVFKGVCSESKWMPQLHPGEVVYISYPPHMFPAMYLIIATANAILNGGKMLVISYEHSPDYIWHMVAETLRMQLAIEVPIENLKEALGNYVSIEAYSPVAYIFEELYYLALEAATRVRPNMMILLGNPGLSHGREFIGRYGGLVYNLLLYFRKLGIATILLSPYHRDAYRLFSHIADIIIRTRTIGTKDGEAIVYYIARKGRYTTAVKDEDFTQCVKEAMEVLSNTIIHHRASPRNP
uniref:KaiC domain-containing protein n=1 Tax=Ignisphaera aggregans TaxID=334771 RepID=A0A7J3I9A3_9CREN